MSLAKNIGTIVAKNTSEDLSGKCSQKPLDHAKQSADARKVSSK